MKNLLVLLLILAMFAPLVLAVPASAEKTAAAKPYFALGWSDLDNEMFPNMAGLPVVGVTTKGDQLKLAYTGGVTNMEKMAQMLKEDLESRPEGMRYIHIWGLQKAYAFNENTVYLNNGADKLKLEAEKFFETCKRIGCPIDGVVIDVEWIHMFAYYIYTEAFKTNPFAYENIVEDARYLTELRPQLEERGFPFYQDVTEGMPEIYSIHPAVEKNYPNASDIWDTVMRNRLSTYNNEALFEPMQKYYPQASFSDYQTTGNLAWYNALDLYGDKEYTGGNFAVTGNAANVNMYNNRPWSYMWYNYSNEMQFKKPESYYRTYYTQSPFSHCLYNVVYFKQMYASVDTKKISLWIAEYDYNASGNHTWSVSTDLEHRIDNTPYWTETVLHAGLLDPQPFLIYMNQAEFSEADYEHYSQVISEVLNELTRVVGYSDRKPIELPINWNHDFVLSGMYANGKNYWRITPDTRKVTLEGFKVEGEDPTFCISGQTITFPGGKIIEDGKVSEVGTCGYWVETAADVMPAVTTVSDRFAQYPAFRENFESYEADTQFAVMDAKDTGAWSMEAKKDRPVVADNGGNKALSLSGTITLRNINHVEKITAGDSYAARQAWEVTVTLPEGFEGEIVLLNTNGKNGSLKDGGFKIASSKIYYDENGEYKELADAKAGTYTFLRTVDFTNAEAFTCSYYLYDATGKELTKAENAAMVTFELPVTAIELATKQVSNAVLLDDYKLYPLGITAELELYDAKTGMPVDASCLQGESTAYRISWMNAASGQSTAKLLYDIYEGDKLVSEGNVLKELKLLPGTDGVELGVFDVKEGQSVKLYVKTEEPENAPEKNRSPMLLLIFGSCVLSLAMIVIAAVAVKAKKPASKKADPPTP